MWSCVREFVRGTRKVSISGCYRVWIHWVQSNTRVISCERTLTSVEVSFTITASAAHTIPSDARSSVPPPRHSHEEWDENNQPVDPAQSSPGYPAAPVRWALPSLGRHVRGVAGWREGRTPPHLAVFVGKNCFWQPCSCQLQRHVDKGAAHMFRSFVCFLHSNFVKRIFFAFFAGFFFHTVFDFC